MLFSRPDPFSSWGLDEGGPHLREDLDPYPDLSLSASSTPGTRLSANVLLF